MFPTFTIEKGVNEHGWWHLDRIETYPEAHERAHDMWNHLFEMS